jgi:hypothetical protein
VKTAAAIFDFLVILAFSQILYSLVWGIPLWETRRCVFVALFTAPLAVYFYCRGRDDGR